MRCSRCKEEKPAAEFYPSELALGSGQCRDCHRERQRRARATAEGREAAREASREANRRRLATHEGREAAREAIRRFRAEAPADYFNVKARLSKYGLTEETFAALIVAQGGRCAICGTDDPGGRGAWHVDHDHACCPGRVTCGGKCIRGLLCTLCKTGLGMFRDNPAILESALGYLNRSTTRTT